jgi:murein DD-endopeptidase MepM/ murein hydrolase activator NlpD
MLLKPFPALFLAAIASLPLAGVSLVMAQTAPEGAPEAAPELPQVVAPAAAPAATPARVVPAPAATGTPQALRPDEGQRYPTPVLTYDRAIDNLENNGAAPRVRVRDTNSLREAFEAGAITRDELNGRRVRGRTRIDIPANGAPAGTASTAGESSGSAEGAGPSIGYGSGSSSGSGERYGIDAAPLPPISVPVTALLSGAGGSFRLTDVFRVTPRPAPIGGNGNARLLVPLIGSATVTSNFGWRIHPVIGSWIMHAGRDLAAPEGTPVVAALSGRVVSSGLAGGYGLAVELEHDQPQRRTLYGHLSELYVKEGEMVRQGEVIGRVGSTGLSTGPHLHFELRLPENGGWVATDPGDLDPGGPMVAGFPGLPGLVGLGGSSAAGERIDAVALLMGQLIQTLERPRAPLSPSPDTPAEPPRG